MLTSSNYRHVVDIDYSNVTPIVVRSYPCRCGMTHSGSCAFVDWNHHNCDHRDWLLLPVPGKIPFTGTQECFAVCEDCGAPGAVHYDDMGVIGNLVQKVRELEDQVAELTRLLLSAADELDIMEKDWANQDG